MNCRYWRMSGRLRMGKLSFHQPETDADQHPCNRLAQPRSSRGSIATRGGLRQMGHIHRVVAIDGPAASGKSSVARELARRLGFAYVNSGAIYRAITWDALQKGIDGRDTERIAQTAEAARISCRLQNNESRIFIDNVDPTDYLREDRVNES